MSIKRVKLHSARELYCPLCGRWHRSGSKIYDLHYEYLVERRNNPTRKHSILVINKVTGKKGIATLVKGYDRPRVIVKLEDGTVVEYPEVGSFYKVWEVEGKKNPTGLYESFHGTSPIRTRKVTYENPEGTLVKIGRLIRIEYAPEYPSKHTGTRFYHDSGDTGTKMLKSNLILATDTKGKNLFLVRDKESKYPFFSSRGVIG